MASPSGSTQAPPQSLPFSFPTDEETRKYMQDFGDLPCIQDMLKSMVVKPETLSIMTAKFQMITSVLAGLVEQDRMKLRQKCDSDGSTIKKLVGEKAELEKRLSSVTEKLNREMEELRGLNSKLNREMEELRGRNLKVSNRLVELGGEIEVAREESEFLRSKNECLCSEVEQARVENKRLQGLVDGFGAREHAIKLDASSPPFFKRLVKRPYGPDKIIVSQEGKRKRSAASRPRPDSPDSEPIVFRRRKVTKSQMMKLSNGWNAGLMVHLWSCNLCSRLRFVLCGIFWL